MPLSPPSGFSLSDKRTQFGFAVNLGVGSRGAGASPKRLVLLGNKLTAGTAALETPLQVYSLDEVAAYCGKRSETYQMAKAVYAVKRDPNLWICPVAEGGGAVKATGTLAFTGAQVAAGVARLWIGGVLFEIAVALADTATAVAAAMAAAVNKAADLPVTATASTGTVTLTAAQGGPRGNNITLRAQTTATSQLVALNGGTAAATAAPSKMGSGTATVGSVADDVTTALAAMAPLKFDRVVLAHDDATNLGRLKSHLNTYAGVGERKRQRGFAATVASQATGKTLSTGLNATRLTVLWHYNADDATGAIAAGAAAACLWGDAQLGGRVKGEESYAAQNLCGVRTPARVQVASTDLPLGTVIRDCLDNGLTPLEPDPSNPGYARVHRPVTTYCVDTASLPDYRVLDTSKVTISDYVAEDLEATLASEYPNKNLAAEPTDGTGPTHPDIVFPSMVRATIASRMKAHERAGLLERADELAGSIVVERSTENPSVLLGATPEDCVDHFVGFGGELNQIG